MGGRLPGMSLNRREEIGGKEFEDEENIRLGGFINRGINNLKGDLLRQIGGKEFEDEENIRLDGLFRGGFINRGINNLKGDLMRQIGGKEFEDEENIRLDGKVSRIGKYQTWWFPLKRRYLESQDKVSIILREIL
eukprot:TRINITY_DN27_c0_g1_i28.p1 TRINITY_DN27_c0_g1~~TRINITY_DN27_c0_g1_i28.p1  ORF type:complete len:135 (+),score=35.42 TRINITY_DN27_c0_g1_i28:159-563(+)